MEACTGISMMTEELWRL